MRQDKNVLDCVVNFFQTGMGVPEFSEKSSSKMETKGVGEEEKRSLAIGFDLPISVYLERVQPKDF